MSSKNLLYDLFQAYYDARKNKRNTISALGFEIDYEKNLFKLYEELKSGKYEIDPSICFIIFKPVQREVFAACFRDRVVHHLIYNYINPVFERFFIHDSYSCRKGKGTSYGIQRISHFMRSCSHNYHKNFYILKLDIKGYFMSINREILYRKIKKSLKGHCDKTKEDTDFVLSIIKKIVFNKPTSDCTVKGKKSDWQGLPKSKSLFFAEENCGLPIGNLTSQLFGNVYLDDFDHFIKHKLGCKYYGRYVDDFIIIHQDKEFLKSIIPEIREYLQKHLALKLHPKKIYLQNSSKGVKFLGSVIKPYRIYIANRTKGNFYQAVEKQNQLVKNHKPDKKEKASFLSSMNSYLGLIKHYRTYNLKRKLLKQVNAYWKNYFYFNERKNKLVLKEKDVF